MNIRSARATLGLSVREMAKALGVNERTIRRMQSGHIPINLRTQLAVSNLLADHENCLSTNTKGDEHVDTKGE